MKKLLLLLTLIAASLTCQAQQVNFFSGKMTAVSTGAAIYVAPSGVAIHQISWVPVGTVTTCSLQVDSSVDGVTWTPAGAIASQTCTTAGQIASSTVVTAYVRLNLTVLTGGGSVLVTYTGFINSAGGSSVTVTNATLNVVGPTAAGGTPATNPVYVAGLDNLGNLRPLATTTAGQIRIGTSTTLGDGIANTNGALIAATSSINGYLGVAPILFNGTQWDRQFYCPNTTPFSVASTTTQVVALSGTTKIRICGFAINPSTSTAGTADIVYGTGTNCATGLTTLTGAWTFPASAVPVGPVYSGGTLGALITPASQALCVRAATATVNGFITWEQH